MVRAFGMNLKIGGSSPPQVETLIFCLKNFHKNNYSRVEN